MNKAIGLIEVKGYGTAITVADTVLKVAAVELLGVQPAKGFGWMTVEITGDVGAVTAAVDAGKVKASETGSLISALVIPRVADSLEKIIISQTGELTPKKQPSNLKADDDQKNDIDEVLKEPAPSEEQNVLTEPVKDIKKSVMKLADKQDAKESNAPVTHKADTKKK